MIIYAWGPVQYADYEICQEAELRKLVFPIFYLSNSAMVYLLSNITVYISKCYYFTYVKFYRSMYG